MGAKQSTKEKATPKCERREEMRSNKDIDESADSTGLKKVTQERFR